LIHDLPAFNDILQTIVTFWHDNRKQLQRSSEEITEILQKSYLHNPHSGEVSADLLDDLYEQLVLQFDPDYGGFGADVALVVCETTEVPPALPSLVPAPVSLPDRGEIRTINGYKDHPCDGRRRNL